MGIKLEESWRIALEEEFTKEYFLDLTSFVKKQYQDNNIYPHPKLIFNAFDTTPMNDVKVVILGQDPYHGEGQANGLAFSVNNDVDIPPSLANIYKEIADDTAAPIPKNGNLNRWAKNGVLLLNSTLTVSAGQAGSHQNKGWERFTSRAIEKLAQQKKNLVFMLWGNYAQKKGEVIDTTNHLVLSAPHPSPLSAHKGFFGCRHFSTANIYLIMHDKQPITW